MRLLVDSGVSDRVLREGHAHEGIDLRFGGVSHRIDFQGLVGHSVWLYPQTDVFSDLAESRVADGADVRFGVTDTAVADITTDTPVMQFTDAEGTRHEISCEFLVGTDGSRSMCRRQLPESQRRQFVQGVPFRVVRDHHRGSAQRPGTRLHPLAAGLRADQPADRDDAADVLPMRP